jgi:thioredoxin reductase (NADPH)
LGDELVEKIFDVIIIGSGPAGFTAAIYTSRAGLKTLVLAGSLWGGQLMLTSKVENFPGFNEGIMGPVLMDRMRRQAEHFGVDIVFRDAEKVDFTQKPFKIRDHVNVFLSKAVIIATGSSPLWLGLESETRLRGRGVSSCATCDGPLYRDKITSVIGGGDTAIEEALTLSNFASKVIVIHRRDKLRATKILQERAFNNNKIEFIWNSIVQEIFGKDKVEGILLKNVKTGELTKVVTDALFVAIGYKPNTEIVKGKVNLDEWGYISVYKGTETSVEGVFVAGDCGDFRYRQAITASGSGCKAALDVKRYLGGI